MDGVAPGGLARGGLAGADVVDGADVAAVEADAGAGAEVGFPGWVGGGGEGCGEGELFFLSLDCELFHGDERAVYYFIRFLLQGLPLHARLPMIMHRLETHLLAKDHTSPDTLLGGDQEGEMLAYLRKANKIGHIVDGNVPHDVDEDLVGKGCHRAGRRWHALDLRGLRLDFDIGEADDEIFDGLGLRLRGWSGWLGG